MWHFPLELYKIIFQWRRCIASRTRIKDHSIVVWSSLQESFYSFTVNFNSPNSTSSASITITVEGRLHCCSMHSLLVTNTFRFDCKSLRWLISTAASVRSRRCSTLNWIPNVFCYGKKPILETASHTNRALIQPQEPNKTFVFIQNGLILELLLPTNTNDGVEAPPKRRNCFIVKLVASSSGGHSSLKVIAYPNLICLWMALQQFARYGSLDVFLGHFLFPNRDFTVHELKPSGWPRGSSSQSHNINQNTLSFSA